MRWVIAFCLLCLGVTAAAAGERDWGRWAEEARKQHPLAGSFYLPSRSPMYASGHWGEPGSGAIGWNGVFQREDDRPDGTLYRFMPSDTRGPALMFPAMILLLGEVHDNPAHHKIRAWLIENRPPRSIISWGAVVFEQIRTDQQPALDQFKALAETGRKADDLFRLLEWEKSGWPPASIYKPLFEAVVAARLPIVAGSAPRKRVRDLARGTPLSADERDRLRFDRAMPQPLLDALRNELRDSHCGLIPEAALGGMAAAQRYRDAHLADALLSAEQRQGSAVLIAGNGHVRSDRGVPWHIRQRKPDARVMSVLIVEVEDGKTEPMAYLPRDPEGKPAADLLIFTPRAERGDPCEEMRQGVK